jgi:hypothetical protein
MATKLWRLAVLFTGVLIPLGARGWGGDTWASISRATIQSNADLMIDSTWTPKNTITNWEYTSSSSGDDVYYTFKKGTTYTGVAYCQANPVDNWAEFSSYVSNTAGGTVSYGNDCSGFVSVCWKLPARKVTATFESQLGTYWTSLGAIGSAATTSLLVGDALNSSSVGHIVLFLSFDTTGVRTMEQTPYHAQRKLRTFSNLAEYRPIRRLQVTDAPALTDTGLSRVADAGSAVALSVSPGNPSGCSYRWQFNGSQVAGATTSRLAFSAAQLTNAGSYVCVVTNAYGAVTSRVMNLVVYPPQTTVLFDACDNTSGVTWRLNRSSSDTRVAFNYDYSVLGIPAAPHGSGGTRGLRMEANMTAGVVSALSLSPISQVYTGDYRLRFDMWINANGPFPAGGTGSSQHVLAGLGTAGDRVEWNGTGSTADGYYFAVDGEGQADDTSTTRGDFCAYAGTTLQDVTSGVYAAGTDADARGNLNGYYVSAFPGGLKAPALQQTNYSQQTGALAQGTVGFAWREVIVSRRGNTVDWSIDGIRLATLTNASFTASNVCIGYWDMYASLSDNTNLSFGLVDNVRVEVPVRAPSITAPPQGQTVGQGSNVMFTVTAGGVPAPGYQWRFNGAAIAGATGPAFQILNAQTTNGGSYSVVVTNSGGALTSGVAVLTVTVPPAAPGRFASACRLANGWMQLSMTGTPNRSYVLQATTDWQSWTNLCTVSSPDGCYIFTDPATNNSRRFYRIRPVD